MITRASLGLLRKSCPKRRRGRVCVAPPFAREAAGALRRPSCSPGVELGLEAGILDGAFGPRRIAARTIS